MLSAIRRAWQGGLLRGPGDAAAPPAITAGAPLTAPPERERRVAVERSAERIGSPVVAWLRIVEEDGGAGVRAALFLTSGCGEPVGFRFTRGARNESTSGAPRAVVQADVASPSASLLQAAGPRPVLVLGRASDTARGFTGDVAFGLPCGYVEPNGAGSATRGGDGASGQAVEWSREPDDGSAARRLFDEISRRADAFEPLERAGRALAMAFADRRVEDLTAVGGLTTVVALSAPPRPAARTDRQPPGALLPVRASRSGCGRSWRGRPRAPDWTKRPRWTGPSR